MYGFENRHSAPVCTFVALITKRGRSGRFWSVRVVEEVLAIRAGDLVGDRSGREDPADDRALVDRLPRERAERLDELLDEVRGDTVGAEAASFGQFRPRSRRR